MIPVKQLPFWICLILAFITQVLSYNPYTWEYLLHLFCAGRDDCRINNEFGFVMNNLEPNSKSSFYIGDYDKAYFEEIHGDSFLVLCSLPPVMLRFSRGNNTSLIYSVRGGRPNSTYTKCAMFKLKDKYKKNRVSNGIFFVSGKSNTIKLTTTLDSDFGIDKINPFIQFVYLYPQCAPDSDIMSVFHYCTKRWKDLFIKMKKIK